MPQTARWMLSGFLVVVIASGCGGAGTLGSDSVEPTEHATGVTRNERQEPGPDGAMGQNGPYYKLLALEASEVEALIGKPSSVSEVGMLGGSHSWRYADLGLAIYITPLRLSNKQIVTTVYQSRGRVVGILSVGDTEEQVTTVAGPITATSKGDRMAQLVTEKSVFTLYVDRGRLVKVRIEPLGREG